MVEPKVIFKKEIKWEKTKHDYFKTVLGTIAVPQKIKFEVISLPIGMKMFPHFHSHKDEFLAVTQGSGTIKVAGLSEMEFDDGILGVFIPRGFTHEIKPGVNGITYLVVAYTDGDITIPSIAAASIKYQYGIYPVQNKMGQKVALGPMSYIQRWKHEGRRPDQEQYIEGAVKTGSDVKIIIFYDNGLVVGSALVGKSEGYDLEKTQAMISYGGGKPGKLNEDDVWINYQSWECLPNESPFAFNEIGLGLIWEAFTAATKDAFPKATSVAVRSRHAENWQYVYPPPWELVSQVDLHGFQWEAPDGKIFEGYDERFSQYGILRLPL